MRWIERERKFLIPESKAKEFIKKANKKCGIIQWYLDSKTRIRLEIWKEPTGYRHVWTETTKDKGGSPNRIEREISLAPEEVNIKDLKKLPFVMKMRHILNESHPEVIVDQFLRENSDKGFLCEIELSNEDTEKLFERTMKELGLDVADEVTGNQDYENENLAKHEQEQIANLIEFMENQLKEETTVIMLQGTSLFAKKYKCRSSGEQINISNRNSGCILLPNELPKDLMYEKEDDNKIVELPIYKCFNPNNPFDYGDYYGLCAELDSLYHIKKLGYKIHKVVIFVFPDTENKETKEYEFSLEDRPKIFEYLKALIENAFGIEVGYRTFNYSAINKRIAMNTLKRIWDEMSHLVEEDKGKEIIVDVAPGQKYPGIMAAMYCLFNHMPFFYKFEKSKEIIKFPPIPAGWDFGSIDEMLAGFKSIMQPERFDNLEYSHYSLLPQIFRNAFMPGIEDYASVLPLKEIFDKYAQARKMPFGYGEEFFKLISSDYNNPLVKYLRAKITTQWSMQWIGDQIPETVEHSQRHSKRLMEFTVNLVNALGQEEFLKGVPKELAAEFYFVLAIAMNVHDLGHTKLVYKKRDEDSSGYKELGLDGLPSVVRDLHNELTYQMLQEEETYHLLEAEERPMDEKTWEKVKEAVKLVSRYHRGYMPIDEASTPIKRKQFMDVFSLYPVTLEEECDKKFGNDQNWKRLTMTAARWLKFIDGVDVQADRTVDPAYRKIRIRRTAYEIKYLIEKFLTDYSKHFEDAVQLKEIHSLVGNIWAGKNTNESTGMKIAEIAKEIESNVFYPKLKEVIETEKKYIAVPSWLRLLDRIVFKALQFPHFEKHNLIRYVYPRFFRKYSVCGNFNQTLYLSLSVNRDEIKNRNHALKVLKGVKDDIIDEFKKAGLDSKEFPIRLIKMEVEPVNEKILITPLGTSPGVLFTLIKKLKPDRIHVITSKKGAEKIREVCEKANYDLLKIEFKKYIFEDPYAGFTEMGKVFKEFENVDFDPLDEIILNLAGGTSFLQYVASSVVERIEKKNCSVKKVFAIDKRDFREQKENPYVVGEVVELP